MTRPVFSPTLGAFFQSLRQAKGWSQAKAVHKASKLPRLTKNVLWRLERGKIKQPDREVLMDVAALYEQPYATVAAHVAALVYGLGNKSADSDQLWQGSGVDSPLPHEPSHVQRVTPSFAALAAIRAEVSALGLQFARLEIAVTDAEAQSGFAGSDTRESQNAADTETRTRRARRPLRTGTR